MFYKSHFYNTQRYDKILIQKWSKISTGDHSPLVLQARCIMIIQLCVWHQTIKLYTSIYPLDFVTKLYFRLKGRSLLPWLLLYLPSSDLLVLFNAHDQMSRCLGNVVGGVYDVPCSVGEVRVTVVLASWLESLWSLVHLTKGHLNPLGRLFLQVSVCERGVGRESVCVCEREKKRGGGGREE